MIRCKFKCQTTSYFLIIFIQLIYLNIASEFPERECCDPIYPLLPNPEPSPSATASTTNPSVSSSPATTFGHSGETILCNKKKFIYCYDNVQHNVRPYRVEKYGAFSYIICGRFYFIVGLRFIGFFFALFVFSATLA